MQNAGIDEPGTGLASTSASTSNITPGKCSWTEENGFNFTTLMTYSKHVHAIYTGMKYMLSPNLPFNISINYNYRTS